MTGHDVGKQTDCQCKGFCKDTEQLNDWHKGHGDFQPRRNFRPKDILPIGFCTKDIDSQKSHQRQKQRNGNVACHISAARKDGNQAHQVVYEDKKESRQQIGSKALVILTHTANNYIIMDHHHKHFHKTDKTFRSFRTRLAILIPTCYPQHDNQQQSTVNHQRKSCLRDGNIQRPYFIPLSILLHNFAGITAFGSYIKTFIFAAMSQV